MLASFVRLLLVLALATAVLWIGLPIAASAVVGAALGANGLHGDGVSASVAARPPLKLLLLEADSVRIQGSSASWRGLVASRIDVTLGGLRLGAPPRTIEGRLESVAFEDAAGSAITAESISLSGSAATPDVEVRLAALELAALVARALPADLGRIGSVVGLAPPDGLRIATAAGDVIARLSVESDGGLALVFTGPGIPSLRLTVLEPGPALAIRLRSVAIEGAMVVLRGTVDARSLGL